MQDKSEQSSADVTQPGKVSKHIWMLPIAVLIPFLIQPLMGLTGAASHWAMLAVGLVAALLVGRHLSSVYESSRKELDAMRVQAQQNCEQRDAAIDTLGHFFSEVLPIWARQIKMAQNHAREEVEILAQHFDKIILSLDSRAGGEAASLGMSTEERREIQVSLNNILISLQFQDRVNQILEAVGLNLEQIAAHIEQILEADSEASLQDLLSLTSWLDLMQDNYTMVEQKLVHHEEDVAAAPSAESNEIEFF